MHTSYRTLTIERIQAMDKAALYSTIADVAPPQEHEEIVISILHDDCMAIMARYEDNHFDLAIVDPPYGINSSFGGLGRGKGQKVKHKAFHGDDKEPPNKQYFIELQRVSRNQIIWGANHFISNLPQPADAPCWLLWDKKNQDNVSFAQFEMAWTSFPSVCRKFEKVPMDRFRIHPTQKPVELYAWVLHLFAKPGDKILDTHLGSGSSAIAAHYAGLDFVGCELDEHYFDLAQKRFADATRQMAMF